VIRLDKRFPFSQVYGHPIIKYEQGGLDFDKFGELVKKPKMETRIPIAELDTAKQFLKTILMITIIDKHY
jgi:hypothetical protein